MIGIGEFATALSSVCAALKFFKKSPIYLNKFFEKKKVKLN